MHELSIAAAIVERAAETAGRHGAARVAAVRVRVGELAGVVPDALRFSFEVAREGTVLETARLLIEEVPGRARCAHCAEHFAVGMPPLLWCPRCDRPAEDLTGGRELEITGIELEEEASV
ncbi:hydrogenase maturation nickel metallochaperone HypA [Streptomyces cinnamoneus]|uniref:Hydrogenase maturation factor HypA n=1 Tax=Streptomyces cinnamoneus TaxID=53446 RepID=A0A2G1XNV7_STRCJ|nr:hydrogenase maturation nickel metallochaperone HypA [Streptomyces cinnamoneus]PHQ52922.1 hydrogenase maturation nickel metallochaperone HypA [Streptomyces cinnamoneus]PPT11417.1 hydrogenase maturation nickel metallochaperone HypA [Streptomyces cinnamoneus]